MQNLTGINSTLYVEPHCHCMRLHEAFVKQIKRKGKISFCGLPCQRYVFHVLHLLFNFVY